MRTQTYQTQCIWIWLLINQNQVRLDVAIAVIFSVAREPVITVPIIKDLVVGKGHHYSSRIGL